MKELFSVNKDGCRLGEKPFFLVSGSLHYFRIHQSDWKRRLNLAKDFGLTAVQTYVPWNAHEPQRGKYDFSGRLNLAEYLEAADKAGLKVMLRPSPYICSEWDFGGLPWWLLRDHPRIALRCCDSDFISALEEWYERLCREFVPYLSTNGGPVILTAVENEYGSYGTDREYMKKTADILRRNGVDVPFYTTDGAGDLYLKYGAMDGVWTAVNYRIESEQAINYLRSVQKDKVPLIGEYWSGRSAHWGEEFHYREIPPIAQAFRKGLDMGACMTFYMFGGGTNFGFYNGANYFPSNDPEYGDINGYYYNPITTSYDVDALLNEGGAPTAKYYACRRELDEYLGRKPRADGEIDNKLLEKTQSIPEFSLNGYAPLEKFAGRLVRHTESSARPLTMEEANEGFGFIIYSSILPAGKEVNEKLYIDGLHDRALVYLDRKYIGTLYRNDKNAALDIRVPASGARLDILVENMGRINFGMYLGEQKGITGNVRLGQRIVSSFTMRTLPLDDISDLEFENAGTAEVRKNHPAFYMGTFDAKAGYDTWLHTENWHRGAAWINGTCIGRYWKTGPQLALYVPGALIRDRDNEIIMFELHSAAENNAVDFTDHPMLDGRIIPDSEDLLN